MKITIDIPNELIKYYRHALAARSDLGGALDRARKLSDSEFSEDAWWDLKGRYDQAFDDAEEAEAEMYSILRKAIENDVLRKL